MGERFGCWLQGSRQQGLGGQEIRAEGLRRRGTEERL